MKRVLLGAVCAALLGVTTAPAHAAFDDPLFFYATPPGPPPVEYLDGPCGLAVSSGSLYVSDHYHRSIDVFTPENGPQGPTLKFSSQPLTAFSGAPNPHAGPVDDPCGLALDSTGTLYVNDYHREVVRFGAPLSLTSAQVIDTGDPTDPYANPTGVAVGAATNHVFVDDRTYLAEYDAAGTFVRKIGEGSLEGGYGIAVSGYSATSGYLYVPDADSDTVKIYDPSFSTSDPKMTIAGPPGGFGSLRDSAIAVDTATGEIYVADTLGEQFSEEPQATIWVFGPTGAFEGRLKHNTIDAAPVGLAVDNSGGENQGRVYVTSGITENAGIYGYPSHAATSALAPPLSISGGSGGSGSSASRDPSSVSPATRPAPSSLPDSASTGAALSPAQQRQKTRAHRRAKRDHRHRGRHPRQLRPER